MPISSVFVFAIAKGLVDSDPAEKLGAVLKPLRKGRQPAITDLVRLRTMIIAAEEDYARPITRLAAPNGRHRSPLSDRGRLSFGRHLCLGAAKSRAAGPNYLAQGCLIR